MNPEEEKPEEKKPEEKPEAKADELSVDQLDEVAGGGVGTTPSSRTEVPSKPGVPINF